MIYLLDIFGFGKASADENWKTLQKELKAYHPALLNKPHIVVANKMDLSDSSQKLKILKVKLKGKRIYPISAATGAGILPLLDTMIKLVSAQPPP